MPVNDRTEWMVDEYFLSQMKADAILINTSHGNLVVEEDLLKKLETCK